MIEKFPPTLVQIVRATMIKGFGEQQTLLDVTHTVLSAIHSNGHGKNWICYIRPALREKCLGYFANPRIDFSFTRGMIEYRAVIVKLCK